MQHIASISYGKDSLAMLEVIKSNKMPLDRIVHVELMATSTISADLPEVTQWKEYADGIIKNRYGIEVEHFKPEVSFEDKFTEIPENRLRTYAQRKKGIDPYAGKIRGFPMAKGHWCSKALKINTLNKIYKAAETVQYIGIAADETKRFGQLNERVKSPLAIHGITEIKAKEICESIGLLAPTYLQSKRSGCWFCPFQPIKQLKILHDEYPELWRILLKWDELSPVPFRYPGKPQTVKMLNERFENENSQMQIGNKTLF